MVFGRGFCKLRSGGLLLKTGSAHVPPRPGPAPIYHSPATLQVSPVSPPPIPAFFQCFSLYQLIPSSQRSVFEKDILYRNGKCKVCCTCPKVDGSLKPKCNANGAEGFCENPARCCPDPETCLCFVKRGDCQRGDIKDTSAPN